MNIEDREEKKVKVRPSAAELAEACAEIAYDRKASDIIRLDMSEHSAVAEQFVICTGTSDPHLRAITERIRRDIRSRYGLRGEVDGSPESHWMIVDFGSVMVHVMDEDTRSLYQLESLWGDAPKSDAIKRIEAKAKRKAAADKKKQKEA